MKQEIKEAIENVIEIRKDNNKKWISFEGIRQIVYSVLLEIDSSYTVAELCDELCISSNQRN